MLLCPNAVAWALTWPGPAAAAAQDPTLELRVQPRGEAAEIGKDLVLDLFLQPPAGHALRAQGWQVVISAGDGDPFFGEPYPARALTAPVTGSDPQVYAGTLQVEWAAPVPAGTAIGPRQVTVKASAVTLDGQTLAGTWQGTVQVDYGKEWSADKITAFIERRGLGLFLVVVFGFGVLMSLSPCIYPMIPITLAVIGGRSQEKGAWHGLVMSVTYVVGMATVYAVLGALSATVFSGITAFMQSPVVLVPIALLLLFLAFSMFGAFELQAPAFLRDRLQGAGGDRRGGLVGVFAMGLVAGLVASPCVGPFLAALLVWVGTTGNWVLGLVSLFTFGIGMGLLLIGVGTFPALLGSLPRSGGWMEVVKKGMGLVLVAMAFWFVRPENVLPARIFTPLLGGTAVLVAVFLGAFDAQAPGAAWWDRTRKGLGLIAFVAGVSLLAGGFLNPGPMSPAPAAGRQGGPGFSVTPAAGQPLAGTPGAASADAGTPPTPGPALTAKVPWTVVQTGQGVGVFLEEQRAAAKAAGKPMMIDFWAQWCVYCKKLDKLVWNQPQIVAESLRFTAIKVDATLPDDADMEAVKQEYQVPGLPRVIFIDSRGEILHGRSAGFQDADLMLQTMQAIR